MKVLLSWSPRRYHLREVAILVEVRDLWVGVYWDHQRRSQMWRLTIYVCLIPCLPIRLTWGRP